jgi:hypothetical protein
LYPHRLFYPGVAPLLFCFFLLQEVSLPFDT